jgi:hypothetical protein
MTPTSEGQIVKFHTVLEGENPDQIYVVLEIHTDCDIPRAKIKALNTGLTFPPVNVVSLGDLEVIPVSTDDLIGNVSFIEKSDGTKILGRIVSVDQPEIYAELRRAHERVETNVIVTVEDKDGLSHTGTLVI